MKLVKFCLLILILFLSGCYQDTTVSRSNLALDTVVNITIYNNGNEELLDNCFDIINNYDKKLDSFSTESTVRQINSTPKQVDNDIYELLETNLNYSRQTNGLFNPTLGTLIELWDINEPEVKEPPSPNEIKEALAHTNINNLILNNGMVSILDNNEIINLGASSKGFIADKLKEYLKDQGIDSALINLGGNILLIGNKDGEEFLVGIDNPDNTDSDYIATLSASDKSIVTSGISQRYFQDSQGNIYHHILNPFTGYPENNDLKEVVIVSDNSLDGDILSTALFLMGKDQAIEFFKNNTNDIDVILVTKDNKIYISENINDKFKLNDDFKDQYQIEVIS